MKRRDKKAQEILSRASEAQQQAESEVKDKDYENKLIQCERDRQKEQLEALEELFAVCKSNNRRVSQENTEMNGELKETKRQLLDVEAELVDTQTTLEQKEDMLQLCILEIRNLKKKVAFGEQASAKLMQTRSSPTGQESAKSLDENALSHVNIQTDKALASTDVQVQIELLELKRKSQIDARDFDAALETENTIKKLNATSDHTMVHGIALKP